MLLKIYHNWIPKGLLLAIVLIGLRVFVPASAWEWIYARSIFGWMRQGMDYVTGHIPFPLVYAFGLGLLLYMMQRIYSYIRKRPRFSWLVFGHSAKGVLNFLGYAVSFFLILWGFNYSRIPLETQLGLALEVPDSLYLEQEVRRATTDCVQMRQHLVGNDTFALEPDWTFESIEPDLRKHLKTQLEMLDYPSTGEVKIWQLPNGSLLRLGISGIYIPYVFQGHVDGALHPIEMPFVVVHEMAHGYGFGGEADCNFLAWLVCNNHPNEMIQYAAALNWWRFVMASYKEINPENWQRIRKTIPQGMRNDLTAIYAAHQQYPDLVAGLQQNVNDIYLKSNGVKAGIDDYNRVVVLTKAWLDRYD
jgi:hypothetical protein